MIFESPSWLLLVPLLALVGWHWRRFEFERPLRVLILALLVLALCDPRIGSRSGGLDLWVLVDRSDSAAGGMASQLDEWEMILERTCPSEDRIRWVDFAAAPIVREQSSGRYEGDTSQTRMTLALRDALARFDPARGARVLVLGDGYSTEPLEGLQGALREAGVAVDYRLPPADERADARIASVKARARVQPGEAFLVEATVRSTEDGEIPFEVYSGDRAAAKGSVKVENGTGTIRFHDRRTQPGGVDYRIVLHPVHDGHPENNTAQVWVETTGGERILLVTAFVDDPMVRIFQASGFPVDIVTDPKRLTPGMLAGAPVIVLNNVPAYAIPPEVLEAIPFAVKEQGAGLLMTGGRYSFGSGGYFSSPLDDLLPVSMELKKEHRKLAVAMSIVMDRSGSMSAGVGGGGLTKMDMADAGAARAIELLGDFDLISVFAVDSEAHSIVELSNVGPNRAKLIDTVRRIRSEGGGIFIYNGLKAGWEELKKADVGQRHLILFADAADSEEPGDYKSLIKEMTEQGATISVIAMGTEGDSDADLLKDIAALGKGRIFFNDNPGDLPALFAQETVAVARSAFIEDPTKLEVTPGWRELAERRLEWPEFIGGYNLSYLRPGATAAVVTLDEYGAPLLAFWQKGIGRTAAVSFPVGGAKSEQVRAWPQLGDMTQTLARWLEGDALPTGAGLQVHVEGDTAVIEFLHDSTWDARVAASFPKLLVIGSGDKEARPVAWERLKPGSYRALVKVNRDTALRGVVQVGSLAIPFGPVSVGVNPEWSFDRARLDEFKAFSAATGGVERVDLSEIWSAPRHEVRIPFRMPLLVAVLVLFLIEMALARIGMNPGWGWVKRLRR